MLVIGIYVGAHHENAPDHPAKTPLDPRIAAPAFEALFSQGEARIAGSNWQCEMEGEHKVGHVLASMLEPELRKESSPPSFTCEGAMTREKGEDARPSCVLLHRYCAHPLSGKCGSRLLSFRLNGTQIDPASFVCLDIS